MIRIIAGKYKGRTLSHINNSIVRPTLARVRKSVMQILEPFEDQEVLDLFCGVGTLGIEALSRGAKSVTMVEKSPKVFRLLQNNVKNICPEEEAFLILNDTFRFVNASDKKFDTIIADPPYNSFMFTEVQKLILPLLKPGGCFCMEMKKIKMDNDDLRIKIYGKTQVVFWNLQK